MKGKLTLYLGPMFSGKTTELINIANHNPDAEIIKPSYDNRYGENQIKNHNGQIIPAISAKNRCDFNTCFDKKLALIDEIQFFEEPIFESDIIDIIDCLLIGGTNVICFGLDYDYKRKEFEIPKILKEKATLLVQKEGICKGCGSPSKYTALTNIPDNKSSFVVGLDDYEDLCKDCHDLYLELYDLK